MSTYANVAQEYARRTGRLQATVRYAAIELQVIKRSLQRLGVRAPLDVIAELDNVRLKLEAADREAETTGRAA